MGSKNAYEFARAELDKARLTLTCQGGEMLIPSALALEPHDTIPAPPPSTQGSDDTLPAALWGTFSASLSLHCPWGDLPEAERVAWRAVAARAAGGGR